MSLFVAFLTGHHWTWLVTPESRSLLHRSPVGGWVVPRLSGAGYRWAWSLLSRLHRPSNLTQIGSNGRFFARVTLKFDGWPRKIIRHVFYTTSSFVNHFRSISEFKLELQSENAQSGSNSMISWAVWPCNLKYDLEKNIRHLFYATSSFVQHFVAIGDFKLEIQTETPNLGQNRRFLEPCDLAIWRVTLKNNRAPLLCYFKLCASFRSHWWIQTGVTVRKRPIWVKIDDFLAVWPCNLTYDLQKQ